VTDIYALGMVLFELLAGELPFAEDPTLTRALKRLQGLAPIATTGAAELPPKLVRLIARCLAVAPSERPQSTAALLQELRAVEEELPLRSVPISSRKAAQGSIGTTTSARTRLLLAGAVLAGVGVLVALGWRATKPSAAVVSTLPSPQPFQHASPPTSALANRPLLSTAEPVVAAGTALPSPQHRNAPTKRRISEPRAVTPTQTRGGFKGESGLTPATAEPSCSPPYYFDGDGFRVYRKECL
jgi:serine/threonine protein kinase